MPRAAVNAQVKVEVNTGHDAICYKGPHQGNAPILCHVWIYLKPNVCICIIAGERKRLTSIQSYPSASPFSHFIGEENQEKIKVKNISMIAKNSWNDDSFPYSRALGQRKLCTGTVVYEKWQIDKCNIKISKNLVVVFLLTISMFPFLYSSGE